MSYTSDIRRIAKQDEPKKGLSIIQERSAIHPGISKPVDSRQDSITSPLTIEILTFDDAQDVTVTTPTGTATIKTAETAQIVDANGKIFAIDTIIYPVA